MCSYDKGYHVGDSLDKSTCAALKIAKIQINTHWKFRQINTKE